MTFSKPEINVLKFDAEKIVTSALSVQTDGVEAAKDRAEANGYHVVEVDMINFIF